MQPASTASAKALTAIRNHFLFISRTPAHIFLPVEFDVKQHQKVPL
jgi:hypothetical protein